MKFAKVVSNIRRVNDLKRIASAYVIDYRNLDEQEIRDALLKTAPQYSNESNVGKQMASLMLHEDRDVRTIAPAILSEVLLNQDDFVCSQRSTEDYLIDWEQHIIDRSNEDLAVKKGNKIQNLKLFSFVLEAAWEDDIISPDEKNLIEKVRNKLRISETEYRIIEAKLGKFPKAGNFTHTRGEVESVRRTLQAKGLIFTVRDDDDDDYDVIPEEVATAIRRHLGIELRKHGYNELLSHRFIRSKEYITEMLTKAEVVLDGRPTLKELQEICLDFLTPSQVLGGFTPNDGLPNEKLREICAERNLKISGTKSELIQRIILSYDQLLLRSRIQQEDIRETYFQYYEKFASRDLDFLRTQQLITKDLECERKFEEATSYLFETLLGHKPLPNIGTERPDGSLSFGDRLIFWDNKSKESACSLNEHLKQFDRYIKNSTRPVAAFLVIAPSFSDDSETIAIQYQVEHQTPIVLIEASELKWIAESWVKVAKSKNDTAFPLGYLAQAGRLRKSVLESLMK